MKLSTINTIKRNAAMGRNTIHGAYTYAIDVPINRGEWRIKRCKTIDATRQWIDADGNIFTAWEWVEV